MKTKQLYIIDSDVFIAAKNRYYAFEICPGFWDSLIYYHGKGNAYSIDKIKNELLAGRETEDLVQWVKKKLPVGFFLGTDDPDVVSAYMEVMLWVQQNAQYFDQAKAKFATGADGWLVSYAMAHNAIVVTNEQPRPEAKNTIPIPDVCAQFNVAYKDVFFMLKEFGARFELVG